jgi:hypothetical protein
MVRKKISDDPVMNHVADPITLSMICCGVVGVSSDSMMCSAVLWQFTVERGVWCWLATFEFHLIFVSGIIDGCSSRVGAAIVRDVASKRGGWVLVLVLVLGKEHGAMSRRQGPFERCFGGRQVEGSVR